MYHQDRARIVSPPRTPRSAGRRTDACGFKQQNTAKRNTSLGLCDLLVVLLGKAHVPEELRVHLRRGNGRKEKDKDKDKEKEKEGP